MALRAVMIEVIAKELVSQARASGGLGGMTTQAKQAMENSQWYSQFHAWKQGRGPLREICQGRILEGDDARTLENMVASNRSTIFRGIADRDLGRDFLEFYCYNQLWGQLRATPTGCTEAQGDHGGALGTQGDVRSSRGGLVVGFTPIRSTTPIRGAHKATGWSSSRAVGAT